MRVQVEPEKQYGAFALIKAEKEYQPHYLVQWNQKWGLYNLIGGKLDNDKGDDCSLARTIYRELEEELGLKPEEECLIINLMKEIEMRQFSHREQRYKDYFFGIFEVDLFPRLPMSAMRKISAARWLSTENINNFISRQEIENLCTRDGHPISVTTRRILQHIEECSPYICHKNDGPLPPPLIDYGKSYHASNQTIAQTPPRIVCELLPDGTIIYVNEDILQITGYQPNEIVGNNWWRLFFPGNGGYQVNQLYRRIEQENLVNYEMTLTTRKHQSITMYFNISVQQTINDNLHHIVCVGS
ncbi:MAG: PAS domain-containing protein [Chloroflexi bacterium]|nr:MAG: PAS domain-containing protein [Chloroflexota bacterium]